MAITRAELTEQVADLYQHLYDPVYLRTHPLAHIFLPDVSLDRNERAQRMHALLQGAIRELDPLPEAPADSRERRRFRLMVLRYLDGLDPLAVAESLAISRRQYYREHDAAVEAIASLFWDRYLAQAIPARPDAPGEISGPQTRLDMLRTEAARAAMRRGPASIAEVMGGISSLLAEMLRRQDLCLELSLAEELPGVAVDQELLRQFTLAVLGYLSEHATEAAIALEAHVEGPLVILSARLEPPPAKPTPEPDVRERVSRLEEMAVLSGAHIVPLSAGGTIAGFRVELPASHERTVLVVDDNEDVLELFKRYLGLHYDVVTASTADEGLTLARRLQPCAVTLDLMMPSQDGWTMLQTLRHHPDTSAIPVIVCSVLRQKELALSLGASGFLEKPVTQQALMAALTAVA